MPRVQGGEANTRVFSVEEKHVTFVKVYERPHTREKHEYIMQDFRAGFGKVPPSRDNFLKWERKIFTTGCVKDAKRSGRSSTR
ncbi:hypothetical protein ANN_26943 [Periplaneta americana]|uniref:Uncharacterized protein n=1 Tax=Periplaneta americana TaxID=6978 RepID=A0ABQ8RWR0_PERAM|nr:hypothetical protein ANN_26943 [Periplaneta americana]